MRLMQVSYLTALTVPLTMGSPLSRQRRVTCTDEAVVFALRGSDPAQSTLGPNPRYNDLPAGMTNTANGVISKAGGNSYLQPIQYPAVKPDPPSNSLYKQSVSQGAQALKTAILDYVDNCPKGKIFILGYSQGAQVTSITLGGNEPLPAGARVTGVVLFADPTYIDNVEPIDAGDARNNGRNGTAAAVGQTLYVNLNSRFPTALRSFCQAEDRFCDSGTVNETSQSIHLDAPQHFEKAAIAFLTRKIQDEDC